MGALLLHSLLLTLKSVVLTLYPFLVTSRELSSQCVGAYGHLNFCLPDAAPQRQRLEAKARQLQLTLQRLEQATITPPLPPVLPTARHFYAMGLAF